MKIRLIAIALVVLAGLSAAWAGTCRTTCHRDMWGNQICDTSCY